MAGYIKDLFTASGLEVNVGLVQTAYSNGNSTKYVTDKLVYILFVYLFIFTIKLNTFFILKVSSSSYHCTGIR